MTAKILDGKAIAQELRESIRAEVDAQVAKGQNPPGLAVILVGEDPASQVYVRNKKIACEKAGFNDVSMVLPADTTEEQLLAEIDTLNARNDVRLKPSIDVQLRTSEHRRCTLRSLSIESTHTLMSMLHYVRLSTTRDTDV